MANLVKQITATRLVPVVVLDDAADAHGLADALVSGGLPVAEVTFRTAAASEAIREISSRKDILVGAGTVLNVEQVDQALDAGARFVVSPGLSEAVVRRCQDAGVPVFPGAVTATEVQQAIELGLEVVKFFPAETSGGAKAIKALSAPFAAMSFIPTGGIGTSNLAEYLALDCVAAVGGSWMVPRQAIRDHDFTTIEKLTRDAVAMTR